MAEARSVRGRRRGLAAIASLAVVAVLVMVLVALAPERSLRNLPMPSAGRTWAMALLMPPLDPAELGDGRPATTVRLQDPVGIALDGAGRIFVSDRGRGGRGRVIWRVDPDGRAHLVAGTGRRGNPLPGRLALDSPFRSPEGICLDAEGGLYIADSKAHMVVRIEPDGRLSRIAGTGEPGSRGDGGPALEAELDRPFDVRIDASGNLYIADFHNHKVRRVRPDGIIETVAGSGEPGYSGDGGEATAARLNGPYGIFPMRDGRLLIADSLNHVIRVVDTAGTITTLAGTGVRGYGGDGGPAIGALFDTPQAVSSDQAGRLYVNDEHNHAIRVIELDGTVSTLLGDGAPGYAGDGEVATASRLNDPENLAFRVDGAVLVTDGDNGRVRMLAADGIVATVVGGE